MPDSNSMSAWTGIITTVAAVAGVITAVLAAFFYMRKLYHWLRPIRVEPSIKMVYDDSAPDEIQAKIINRSREAQYVVRCVARSTYPLSTIMRKHVRSPMVSPRLYQNIWFNVPSFSLLGKESQKIEPFESVELRHRLSNHPLSFFLTPMFQVEVHLSTGRVIRSRRLDVPERWRFKT